MNLYTSVSKTASPKTTKSQPRSSDTTSPIILASSNPLVTPSVVPLSLQQKERHIRAHHQNSHDRVSCNLAVRGVSQTRAQPDAPVNDSQSDDCAAEPDVTIRPHAALTSRLELCMVQLAQGALDKQQRNEDNTKVLVKFGKVLVSEISEMVVRNRLKARAAGQPYGGRE